MVLVLSTDKLKVVTKLLSITLSEYSKSPVLSNSTMTDPEPGSSR